MCRCKSGDTAIVNTLQSSQKLYLSDDTDQVGVFTKLILNTEDRVYFTKTTGECYMGIWNPNDDKITLDLISSDKTPTPTPDISIPTDNHPNTYSNSYT